MYYEESLELFLPLGLMNEELRIVRKTKKMTMMKKRKMKNLLAG